MADSNDSAAPFFPVQGEQHMDVSPFDIVVFEDQHVARLDPIATARPAYAITCGSYRLLDWLSQLKAQSIVGRVRPHLRQIQRFDFESIATEERTLSGRQLYINAR